MRFFLNGFLFLFFFNAFAQQTKALSPIVLVDSLYREDQFYVSFTYNTLVHRPAGFSQNKFSSGYTAGFLRDMPINKQRTRAIAAGLGFSYNKLFQNLLITPTEQGNVYQPIPTTTDYGKNKIDEIAVELPIEYRWRNSTPDSHLFWRVYTGVKVSYVVYDKYVHEEGAFTTKIKGNEDMNHLLLGTYMAAGYNTWNFYVSYGISPLFKPSAKLNGDEAIAIHTLNFGLMFYIL